MVVVGGGGTDVVVATASLAVVDFLFLAASDDLPAFSSLSSYEYVSILMPLGGFFSLVAAAAVANDLRPRLAGSAGFSSLAVDFVATSSTAAGCIDFRPRRPTGLASSAASPLASSLSFCCFAEANDFRETLVGFVSVF